MRHVNTFTALLLAAIALFTAFKLRHLERWLKEKAGQGAEHWPVFPKRLLTPVEQQLYQRLICAFPDHVVLTQVSCSQLVGVKKGENFTAIWNRYNRLTADFVLCSKDFRTLAVIELDDRSHDAPARQDADRRKALLFESAGIPLHRFNVNPLPDERELRSIIEPHDSH